MQATCIAAKEVIFDVAVASMVSAEQRAIETVGSIGLPPSDICLNTPYFLRFAAPS